jgi:hypothetical protein
MAFDPKKPMQNIRFGIKHPKTGDERWICRDMIGTLSTSRRQADSTIFPQLTQRELELIIQYIKKNFPVYLINVAEVTSH